MTLISSAYTPTLTTTLTLTSAWLKDPVNPSLNLRIRLRSMDPVTAARPQGVFYPLNTKHPTIVSGTPQSSRGSFTVLIETQAEMDALDALLTPARPLLFQKPLETSTGPFTSMFLQLVGDLSIARLAQPANRPHRDVTIPYVEVLPPVSLL